jgi:uncharacterized membrane protein
MSPLLAVAFVVLESPFSFPHGAVVNEQIALRWMHIVAGIIWVGTLYFINLVAAPALKGLDAPVRAKVFPELMSRAMWWFRWSALVTVIAGLRYFWMILSADAHNFGDPALAFRWMGWWLLVWLVAFSLIYPFQLPRTGILDRPGVRAIAIAAITVSASRVVLLLNANPQSSNAHLSISIGGGLGLVMLLNAWGVVWRAQKRLIAWTRASAEQGTPMPPEAVHLARWSFLASRTGFWMSLPMLFFMAAADHYPFLGGITG